jgi:hypothetical protein
MREIRQSGSVRGVRRNPHPYRDSGNMFSFDFRKTSAPDYQRRLLRPWPTSPLRCMWAAVTVLLGHRSIRCGPRLRHVGHDYGETKNAAHIRAESRPTSHRNQWPTSNGITGPHRPEYAVYFEPDPLEDDPQIENVSHYRSKGLSTEGYPSREECIKGARELALWISKRTAHSVLLSLERDITWAGHDFFPVVRDLFPD